MGEARSSHTFQLPRATQCPQQACIDSLCQDAFLTVEVTLMHVIGMQLHI